MPRRKQRFSRLLENLRNNGGTPTGTGPLKEFHDYLVGVNKVTQQNKIPVEGRQLYEVGLIPFAVTPTGTTPDQRYIGTISAYSYKGLTNRAAIDVDDLGINFIAGGEQNNSDYYPALVKTKFDASSSTLLPEKTSAITGRKYPYKYGRTFSFPFGRTTSTTTDAQSGATETNINEVDELDVYRSVQTKLEVGTGTAKPLSISYEPEVFKTDSDGQALTATTNVGAFTVS